jgi:hypothetical protein
MPQGQGNEAETTESKKANLGSFTGEFNSWTLWPWERRIIKSISQLRISNMVDKHQYDGLRMAMREI